MTNFHPMYKRDCLVCGHPMKYHDGIGCTAQADENGISVPCPCLMSQAMPDKAPVFNASHG